MACPCSRAALEQARSLPPPVSGDPAHLPAGAAVRLPASLAEASVAFAASSLLRLAFGEDLHASLLDSQARGGCPVAADWRAWLI